MRIKKVSSDRVTVYLSTKDLEFFDFHPGEEPPKAGDLHNFLFELMELVQSETGFDPYHGGQVVVEAVQSPEGMKLNISKLGASEKKKFTREQFNKAKSVRVRTKDFKIKDMSALSEDEFLNLLKNIGIKHEKKTDRMPGNETFVFESFAALEAVLYLMNDEEICNCVLYRYNERYAIVTKIKRWERTYNLLSEFSQTGHGGDILATDIKEGWTEVAHGNELMVMASAVKAMK